jgi:hypothetical protein
MRNRYVTLRRESPTLRTARVLIELRSKLPSQMSALLYVQAVERGISRLVSSRVVVAFFSNGEMH